MTDNEIIKILQENSDVECENCIYNGRKGYCSVEDCCVALSRNALDLINRQKAEIERLKDLNKCYYTSCQQIAKSNHGIKAEAVKEFAERLKEKERPTFPLAMVIDVYEIDNLVKEMVGED